MISLPSSTATLTTPVSSTESGILSPQVLPTPTLTKPVFVFASAVFLVAVPVFFEAPLVRTWPWLSLVLTIGWVGLGMELCRRPKTQIWGELLVGFTWTWLAGSLYWGWFRWEPALHLPLEAIALPIAIWGIHRNWCKIGNSFYLGSLFGTVVTDCYFYLADLVPYWRQLMRVQPEQMQPIFRQAIAQMYTLWGLSWLATLALLLLGVGLFALNQQKLHWTALSGAVLSTILVDGLFWLAASLA